MFKLDGNFIVTQQPINTTLFLVIKNSIIRSGLQTSLAKATNIKIIGEALDKSDVKESIRELCPNILLLEFTKGESPEELKKWINEVCMETKVLILISDNKGSSLSAVLEAGAAGCLNSKDSLEALANAIQRAAQGEVIFNQEQMGIASRWKDNVEIKLKQLTPRENEILRLLAKGSDSKTISLLLDISPKTVAYHITNILSKLSLKSRQEATVWALKHLSDNLE
jgi:DNA-binding NarL/FixJ family response regulator